MPPGWLHRKISREKCEELVTAAGLDDGRFLVRTRDGKPGEYVLCVVFKGKCTHHLMAKNAEGHYCINKKSYGEYTKVNRLIDALGKPGIKGWPVPLNKPVNVEGHVPDGGDAPQAKPAAAKPAAAKPAAAKPAAAKPAGGAAGNKRPASARGPSKWKCGPLSREATEDALKRGGGGEFKDGAFLVRDRPNKPGEYILSVVFKGKPTHHLVTKNEEGKFQVNKKTFGGHEKIGMLIKTLTTKQPGWPVALTIPSAPRPASGAGGGAAGGAAKAESKPKDEVKVEEEKAEEPAKEEEKKEEEAKPEEPAATEPAPEPEAKKEEPEKKEAEPEKKEEAVAAAAPAAASESKEEPAAKEPEPASEPQPAANEATATSVEEEQEQVNRSKEAAAAAYMDVQAKMNELNALQTSSNTAPTLTLMNQPVMNATPTDGPELTFMLARAVLNLGQRVATAEQKLEDLHVVLRSLNVAN